MMVELSDDLSEELGVTLATVISDLGSEIADTDNPGYRRKLQARRGRLQSIVESLQPPHGSTRAAIPAGEPAQER